MAQANVIARAKRIGAGASFIAFPLMLLAGFSLHPNLLSLARVTNVRGLYPAWNSRTQGAAGGQTPLNGTRAA